MSRSSDGWAQRFLVLRTGAGKILPRFTGRALIAFPSDPLHLRPHFHLGNLADRGSAADLRAVERPDDRGNADLGGHYLADLICRALVAAVVIAGTERAYPYLCGVASRVRSQPEMPAPTAAPQAS